MFGQFSYLISIVIFAGLAIFLEWFFGFSILKKYIKQIFIVIGISLLLAPTEKVALDIKAWAYNPSHTFNIKLLGAELETYIYVIFIAIAVSSAVIAWTRYEDKGKNILRQTLKDIKAKCYNKPKPT